jgi:hypothetical protein
MAMTSKARKLQRFPTMPLPAVVRASGEALLDQQMWCWGCDVRRASGNLLTQYGCIKRSSPDPRFHSAYTRQDVLPGGALTLWGWGVWIAAPDHGSLFVSRNRFTVRWLPHVDIAPIAWQERDLPLGCTLHDPSDALSLLCAACRWIADYEGWVMGCCNPSYRAQALEAWPARRRFKGGVSAEHMATQWNEMSRALSGRLV